MGRGGEVGFEFAFQPQLSLAVVHGKKVIVQYDVMLGGELVLIVYEIKVYFQTGPKGQTICVI